MKLRLGVKAFLLLTVPLGLLGGCGIFSNQSGPKMAELEVFKATADVHLSWHYQIGKAGEGVLVPAVLGNTIYAAAADGRLVRLDKGQETWKVETKLHLTGGVSTNGQLIAVGTRQGEVCVFAAKDGKLLWKAKTSSEVIAPPVFTSQGLLVRSGDNTLVLYALPDGKQVWIYNRVNPTLALRSTAAPTVAEPYIFVGFPGGKIVGLSLQNGGLAWEGTVALPKGSTELERIADVVSSPLVEGRQTCAVAYQGRLACFDMANGGVLSWGREFSSIRDLAMDSRLLYAVDDRKAIHAFERETGNPVWKNDRFMLRQLSAPLSITRRALVAVGDVQGYVHLLSREDGSLIGRTKTDGSPIVAPLQLIGNSTILVQTRNGGLFALDIQ